MSPYGNSNLARQELKKVALKALYKLRKEMGKPLQRKYKTNDYVIGCTDLPYSFMRAKWGAGGGGLIAMDNVDNNALTCVNFESGTFVYSFRF